MEALEALEALWTMAGAAAIAVAAASSVPLEGRDFGRDGGGLGLKTSSVEALKTEREQKPNLEAEDRRRGEGVETYGEEMELAGDGSATREGGEASEGGDGEPEARSVCEEYGLKLSFRGTT